MTTTNVTDLPHPTDPDRLIGERILIALRRKGMTQTDLAAVLGMDRTQLNKKLTGKRRWYFAQVATCAVALEMHLAELVGGEAPVDWVGPEPIEDVWRARRDSNPKPSDP